MMSYILYLIDKDINEFRQLLNTDCFQNNIGHNRTARVNGRIKETENNETNTHSG